MQMNTLNVFAPVKADFIAFMARVFSEVDGGNLEGPDYGNLQGFEGWFDDMVIEGNVATCRFDTAALHAQFDLGPLGPFKLVATIHAVRFDGEHRECDGKMEIIFDTHVIEDAKSIRLLDYFPR